MERDASILTRSRTKEVEGHLESEEEEINPSQNRGRTSLQRKIMDNTGNAAMAENDSEDEITFAVARHKEDRPRQAQRESQSSRMQETVEGMRSEISNLIGAVRGLMRPPHGEVQHLEATKARMPLDLPSPSDRAQDRDTHISRPRTRQPSHYEEIEHMSNPVRSGRRGRPRLFPSPPEYSTQEDDERTSNISDISYGRARSNMGSKLPPFTGKEKWKVWINRFMEVARLRRWSDGQKLDEILPRLQGPAGEFVYGQLSHEVRTDFKALVKELNSRFRVVETAKTFGAQFSNHGQKPGEPVEEYAAELKRLYDKAHANRDKETRQEDLLRRFLDGLSDERTRFHVEYIKEPVDIDEAVYEVVNFQETRRKPFYKDQGNDGRYRRPTRTVKHYSRENFESNEEQDSDLSAEEEDADTSGMIRVVRGPTRVNKNTPIKKDDKKCIEPKKNASTSTEEKTVIETKASGANKEVGNSADVHKISNMLQQMNQRLAKLEAGINSQNKSAFYNQGKTYNQGTYKGRNTEQNLSPRPRFGQDTSKAKTWNCYKCGREGHFARECPNAPWMMGQMQVAVQPGSTGGHPPQHGQATGATISYDISPPNNQNQTN